MAVVSPAGESTGRGPYLPSRCEGRTVPHSRPSLTIRGPNAKQRTGLESGAHPSEARTRAANSHGFFFLLSNVRNKIQMNQLFQGQSFN